MMLPRLLPACTRAYHEKVATVTLVLVLLAGGIGDACQNPAAAGMVFNISNSAPPEISIRVGGGGGAVNRVRFNVPDGEVGNSNPVSGNRKIMISLLIRATAANPITGFLTVDSSTQLRNSSGATIPVSEISWTAGEGNIPSGSFTDTSNQLLASFTSSVRVTDMHTFNYANRNIYDAGIYNGQVTYTWSAP